MSEVFTAVKSSVSLGEAIETVKFVFSKYDGLCEVIHKIIWFLPKQRFVHTFMGCMLLNNT
jgi:hypothetical protein